MEPQAATPPPPPSNFKAFALLVLTVSALAYQSIAKDFADAGLLNAAKYIVLAGGVSAAIALAYTEAIRRAGGGGGQTQTSASTSTKTPPTATRVTVALLGIVLGGSVSALVVGAGAATMATTTEGCNTSLPPITPAEVISIEGDTCLIDELADPLLPSGTATVIATFIQNLCSKSIPQTFTAFIAQLITQLSSTPATVVADGSTGSAAPISKLDWYRDHFGVPRIKVVGK